MKDAQKSRQARCNDRADSKKEQRRAMLRREPRPAQSVSGLYAEHNAGNGSFPVPIDSDYTQYSEYE